VLSASSVVNILHQIPQGPVTSSFKRKTVQRCDADDV
jgi:hypothetical protein